MRMRLTVTMIKVYEYEGGDVAAGDRPAKNARRNNSRLSFDAQVWGASGF